MRIFSIMHGNFLILYSFLDRNSVHLLKYSCFIYLSHLYFGGGGECYQENMNLAESWGCLKPLFYHGWNIYRGHSFLWFLIELLYVFPLSCNWLPSPPFCPLSTWKLRETSDVLEEVSPHGQRASGRVDISNTGLKPSTCDTEVLPSVLTWTCLILLWARGWWLRGIFGACDMMVPLWP